MAHDVFISHSSKDKAAADAVCAALESAGIACWIAPRNVRPGTSYAAEIVGAISDARILLLLHSNASNESPEVHREIERAGAKRLAFISVRLEPCEMSRELEYFLSSVQWIDATKPPLADHLGPLVEAVRALMAHRGSLPIQPVSIAPKVSASPRRSTSRFYATAAIVVAFVVFGAWRVLRTKAPAPAATASLAAPKHGVPITGHPPPKTSNPEAAAAYASGLQSFRDGSMAQSAQDFQRAIKLDPSLAAANLRLSMRWISLHWGMDSSAREHFVAASQFRSNLDERDTLLLSFADAFTATPTDFEEIMVRIRKVADRYPDDAEVAFLLGAAWDRTGHGEEGRVAYHHAFEIDPQFAGALWGESVTNYEAGDVDGARALFQQCLDVSPMAGSCLRTLAFVYDLRGQCAEMDTSVRRLATVEPNGSYAAWWMARSLAARDAPDESVRAALDKSAALGGISAVFAAKTTEEAVFALLTGDLAKAESAAREIDRGIANNSSEAIHGQVTTLLMTIAEERGDTAEELRLANEFVKQMPAWTANDPGGVRLWRLYLLHQAGKLADAPFQEQREQLRREVLAQMPPVLPRIIADDMWVDFHARRVETRTDAEDALAHLPSGGLVTLHGINTFLAGRVYFLAGQLDAAIPWLRTAANSCSIMAATNLALEPETIVFLRANLLLGQALEQKGDTAGACAAYGKILARWSHVTPKSVTADAARAGSKHLKCAG